MCLPRQPWRQRSSSPGQAGPAHEAGRPVVNSMGAAGQTRQGESPMAESKTVNEATRKLWEAAGQTRTRLRRLSAVLAALGDEVMSLDKTTIRGGGAGG